MPLVKDGAFAADRFVRSPMTPRCRARRRLLPAERFSSDAEALLGRAGVGVIWPNNRDSRSSRRSRPARRRRAGVSEFNDGRAYSQARLLRER